MVTKNSGNTGGTQEKINAAMRAGTEVIIIEDTGSDECIGIGLSEALKYITEIVENNRKKDKMNVYIIGVGPGNGRYLIKESEEKLRMLI